jgi:hypothetical protein
MVSLTEPGGDIAMAAVKRAAAATITAMSGRDSPRVPWWL